MISISKDQMADLDSDMIAIGMDVPRMMELAGFFVAIAATKVMRKGRSIIALSGTGNNGGDALVAARHLLNWGYAVDVVFPTLPKKLKPVPLHQWIILKKMGVKVTKKPNFDKYGLIIDGLLGYNILGNPKKSYADLILAANKSKTDILSIDIPSGLDASSGNPYNACIKATVTIALTVLKTGLKKRSAKNFTGRLLVAYMGVPRIVNEKYGIKQLFSEDSLIFSYP